MLAYICVNILIRARANPSFHFHIYLTVVPAVDGPLRQVHRSQLHERYHGARGKPILEHGSARTIIKT